MFHVPGFIDGRYNLAFDSERNTSTLSEFIGYAELTDFREFLLKHSRDTDKRKRVGKFLISYFRWKTRRRKKSWQYKQKNRLWLGRRWEKVSTLWQSSCSQDGDDRSKGCTGPQTKNSLFFDRDHLPSNMGIISGPGSFVVQFGDHLRPWDHLRTRTGPRVTESITFSYT